MNEIPSSAVTAARAVVSSSSGDGAGVMAVSPMANPAHGVDLTAVLGHVEALALDDVPLDLLFRARGLVEMAPRGDAPLHAGDDGTGERRHPAPQLLTRVPAVLERHPSLLASDPCSPSSRPIVIRNPALRV